MSRADQNDEFLATSFLYGGNAQWIEELYACYEADPASVDAQWQSFFAALKDDPEQVRKSAQGASWKKPHWPVHANGELVSALDGNWIEVEKKVAEKVKEKAQAAVRRASPMVCSTTGSDSSAGQCACDNSSVRLAPIMPYLPSSACTANLVS